MQCLLFCGEEKQKTMAKPAVQVVQLTVWGCQTLDSCSSVDLICVGFCPTWRYMIYQKMKVILVCYWRNSFIAGLAMLALFSMVTGGVLVLVYPCPLKFMKDQTMYATDAFKKKIKSRVGTVNAKWRLKLVWQHRRERIVYFFHLLEKHNCHILRVDRGRRQSFLKLEVPGWPFLSSLSLSGPAGLTPLKIAVFDLQSHIRLRKKVTKSKDYWQMSKRTKGSQ